MTASVVIPIRISPEAKSRLSAVLDEPARLALVEAMLARVIDAALAARNVTQVRLIGTAPARDGVGTLADPGKGLNAAAGLALAECDADRLIVIHADLPLVTAQDLELLAATPDGEVAIAPDRHGTGTNAISLPLPEAGGFSFAFGPDSFGLHNAEAGRLGLRVAEIHSPGLARDIDEPDDLADAAGLLKAAG